MSDATTPTTPAQVLDASLLRYTNWIYGLHGLAILLGVLSWHSIASRFVFSLPSIIAVIMNYARRADTVNTPFAPHFRWQIRTFWFALLWYCVTLIVSWPLIFIGVGIGTLWLGLAATGVWVTYRVLRGWLALRDGKPLPAMGVP
jgi:uncharacterized membrane protein